MTPAHAEQYSGLEIIDGIPVHRFALGLPYDVALNPMAISQLRVAVTNGGFDVVHAHQFLQHLSDPVAALREMRRVLRRLAEPGAVLGDGVEIGPFCHVGAQVRLDDGVVLKSHVVVTGDTRIGAETTVFPFACIGEAPQDLKYAGEDTRLVIGARNRIREYVTMNPGTAGGGGLTQVGDDGLFMAGSHVAHDCRVGNGVILVNNVAIAGHCNLGDEVIVGGLSGVHQFVRIGRGAMIGALTMVTADVLPFALVSGPRGHLDGLNLVGLKRRGASRADIHELREMLDRLGTGSFRDTARHLAQAETGAMVRDVLGDLGEATPEQVARRFTRGRAATVKPLLETLTAIGQARILEGARFTLSA